MAITPKKLIAGSQLTASAATYYTAPALTRTIIKKLTLTNTTDAAHTATVYLIASGGSASASNCLISAKSIGAGESIEVTEASGQVLEPAGFIQALASAGTAITIQASGLEVV